MIKYPQPADYQTTVQNPSLAFSDPRLQACKVQTNPLGLPIVNSGGFALSFFLEEPGNQKWVVRCFKSFSADRDVRYRAISQFLDTKPASFFVDVDYLNQGIRVDGTWYPIVKMPLVEGVTIHKFIETNANVPSLLASLPEQFQTLVESLERLNIAHGDLQHGNILVCRNQLVLVDYDGMYLPTLRERGSAERGHRNYQHPARNSEFDQQLDRFSSIVIYMALKALTLQPDLWKKYSNGENLLFQQVDFVDPDKSQLLMDLEALAPLKPLVQRFRSVCKASVQDTPRLADLISGSLPTSVAITDWLPTKPKQSEPVYNAHDRDELLKHVGEIVTVEGRIKDAYVAQTYKGETYAFLNFGDYRCGDMKLVVWPETLTLVRNQGRDARYYLGKLVRVSGLLTTYVRDGMPRQPQIVIDVPSQIFLLPSGNAEAVRNRQDILSELYKGWSVPSTPATGLGTAGQGLSQPKSSPPLQQVSPQQIDFGIVREGETARWQLCITNTGGGVLAATIYCPLPCIEISPTKVTCGPNASASISIQLITREIPSSKLKHVSHQQAPGREQLMAGISITVTSNGGLSTVPLTARIVGLTPPNALGQQLPSKQVPSQPVIPPQPQNAVPAPTSQRHTKKVQWLIGVLVIVAMLAVLRLSDVTKLMESTMAVSSNAGAYRSEISQGGEPPISAKTPIVNEDDITTHCLTDGIVELRPLLPSRFAGGEIINFRWRWIGELPPDCSFQISLWPQDRNPAVIFVPNLDDPLARINRLPDSTYQISLDVPPDMVHLGHYQWSVDVVQIRPEYQVVASAHTPVGFTWYK